MQATDVMTTDVFKVTEATTVNKIATILLDRHVSAVPVVDDLDHIVGVVSEGDLLHRAENGTARHHSWWGWHLRGSEELAAEYVKSHGRRARDVMTSPVVTVTEETPLAEIAELMEGKHIRRVPVLRDGKLVGIVSRADLLCALATEKDHVETVQSTDDERIREAVLETLRGLKWASLAGIEVRVSGGVAHLWGLVSCDEELRALHVAVENVPGVNGIRDHLVQEAPWIWAF
jgi:CBS domain-containing protein